MKDYLNKNYLLKRLLFVLVDLFSVFVSMYGALLVLDNFTFGDTGMDKLLTPVFHSLFINMALTVGVFLLFRLYNSVWTHVSIVEMYNVILGCFSTVLISFVWNGTADTLIGKNVFFVTAGYYVIYFFILTACVIGTRFSYRSLRLLKKFFSRGESAKHRVMIVGAGSACAITIAELNNSEMTRDYKVVCLIDDNKGKRGKTLNGVPVVGDRYDIPEAAVKYGITDIIIAIPSAPGTEIQKICEICSTTKCKMKILPGIYQLVKGERTVGRMRDVDINDLLGREPIVTDIDSIMDYVSGRTVMVTGGGGSIGSELCRQIAAHSPKKLIIVDIYENNAYDIQQELRRNFPELDLTVLIASVRNKLRIDTVFDHYRPEIVYHAAAHKHVPLMEESPNEAVKNNVFGTLNVVQAADTYGVKRFVMISTDKAVNPTNVMGATKRICEMIIQTYNNHSKTEFVAVRFGNVLGSNGSVIPLFKRQIAEGGPVTVTHPDIIRYFMTIPEAVSLVLQAGAYAKGGEIFVLDMGKQVRIADLAANLIRLSGYVPDRDIKIEYTGLRPGEKLYEELLMDEEGLRDTENKLIHIGSPIKIDEGKFLSNLAALRVAAEGEPNNVRRLISEIVPTYKGDPALPNLGVVTADDLD